MIKIRNDLRNVFIIIVFAIIFYLPFANKAINIDDTAFVYMAKQITKDPLRPYSFELEWLSRTGKATHILDTPLVSYYMAAVISLFGPNEIALHVSLVLFFIMAGISFYYLSKRFIRYNIFATLVMLATPTFLVSSNTLMLDVPVIALLLLSVVLSLYGIDKDKHFFVLLGSIVGGLAYLAKPNGLVVIPLILAYCIIHRKYVYMFYQVIPILFIGLFAVHNLLFEGQILIAEVIPFLFASKDFDIIRTAAFVFSSLAYIGGATVFFIFLVYPFILKKKNYLLFVLTFVFSLIISAGLYLSSRGLLSGQYSLIEIIQFFLYINSALFFIILVLKDNMKNIFKGTVGIIDRRIKYSKDKYFIVLWFIGALILNTVVSGGAVRYNTILLPPMILILFVMYDEYSRKLKVNMDKLLPVLLFFTLTVGLAVTYADYIYADTYRNYAENDFSKFTSSENTIHFLGGGGFQYYMSEKGYRMLKNDDNTPVRGDIIVRAVGHFEKKITKELKNRMRLIKVDKFNNIFPVRVQNPESHAGWYTLGGGFLPFSISTADIQVFEIYVVE